VDDVVDQLDRLQRLREAGALSAEEFDRLKSQLLAPATTAVPPVPPALAPPLLPPSAPARRRRRTPLIIGGLLLFLGAAAGGGALLVLDDGEEDAVANADVRSTSPRSSTTSPPSTAAVPIPSPRINVVYKVEVVTTDYCEDFGDSGYSDIPNAEVELFDGSGNLLGFGTLNSGTDTDTSCIFVSTFQADRSSDGKYRITAGNSNRGFLNYDESELKLGKTLEVEAVIGD
jgi:hypothetical protein